MASILLPNCRCACETPRLIQRAFISGSTTQLPTHRPVQQIPTLDCTLSKTNVLLLFFYFPREMDSCYLLFLIFFSWVGVADCQFFFCFFLMVFLFWWGGDYTPCQMWKTVKVWGWWKVILEVGDDRDFFFFARGKLFFFCKGKRFECFWLSKQNRIPRFITFG